MEKNGCQYYVKDVLVYWTPLYLQGCYSFIYDVNYLDKIHNFIALFSVKTITIYFTVKKNGFPLVSSNFSEFTKLKPKDVTNEIRQ